ncbi:hypothetical protein B0O99DRAFT_625658 [Bisporella sp. PMI_857]|nr:hypothetical protein B0O99DRAFT_625658 [Bisporella sp. PMI_857]
MTDTENTILRFEQVSEPSPQGLSTISIFDEYSNDPQFVESQRELRSLLFDTARSADPTRVGSPENGYDDGRATTEKAGGRAGSPSFIQSIISTQQKVIWLRNYIDEVAPWLDMFDMQQTFGVRVPILARTSASLTYAILAIAARQMELANKAQRNYDSIQLYQEAIRSLTPQLQARDPNAMATCVILCCLEMMSAAPKNWRKHLDGCAALFDSYGINGLSSGLPQAVFWCYARMDLCAAIISEGAQSVVLPIDKWLPPTIKPSQAGNFFRSSGVADMYANYTVWLCARICHLAWTRTLLTDNAYAPADREPFAHSWHKLWSELQDWADNRPAELLEFDFKTGSQPSKKDTFPFILYAAPCAISSNQLYHTGCLLLLDMKPSIINTRSMGHVGSSLWHARRVCGISAANSHHGCLNNAIQPLWLAGKLLSHPVEHKAVIDLIKHIETTTGWSSTWRIKDLKALWGYDKDDTSL